MCKKGEVRDAGEKFVDRDSDDVESTGYFSRAIVGNQGENGKEGLDDRVRLRYDDDVALSRLLVEGRRDEAFQSRQDFFGRRQGGVSHETNAAFALLPGRRLSPETMSRGLPPPRWSRPAIRASPIGVRVDASLVVVCGVVSAGDRVEGDVLDQGSSSFEGALEELRRVLGQAFGLICDVQSVVDVGSPVFERKCLVVEVFRPELNV